MLCKYISFFLIINTLGKKKHFLDIFSNMPLSFKSVSRLS